MNSSPWDLDMMEDAILEDCYINSGKAEKIDVITEKRYSGRKRGYTRIENRRIKL